MYVVYQDMIRLYEGIDTKRAITTKPNPLSADLANFQFTQTPLGRIDCTSEGLIVFDTKNLEDNQHQLKSFLKYKP